MKNAILWQWAKEFGHTPEDLARAMDYSPRYVEQIIRGWAEVTDSFVGRFMQTFPDHAHIFLLAHLMSRNKDLPRSLPGP